MKKLIRPILYILAIVIANFVTAYFAPLVIGMFIVPWGTVFIGLTFVFRDLVQLQLGRRKTYYVIALGLGISVVTSIFYGDMLFITMASALSFIFSEITDTEIFTRFKLRFYHRIMLSGVVGGFVDSIIFIIIGLSPLFTGILTWQEVPYAMLGQFTFKTLMQLVTLGVIHFGFRHIKHEADRKLNYEQEDKIWQGGGSTIDGLKKKA